MLLAGIFLLKKKSDNVVLSSADSCRNIHIYAGYIPTQWITDAGRLLYKDIYLSLYCKGSKRLIKACVWEGAEDRTETVIFPPPLLWPSRCVFLVFLMLNRRSRGPLCWVMASFTASHQQLLWSSNSIGIPEGPFGRVWLSLPHPVYLLLQRYRNSNCLDFCLDWAI